ncbi:MAG: type VI secretion system membrane subunit TssM [Pyrinomonadaceae bacterium]|nr:type VI secretion system membrane subunit TssM [Pyrinomonadaceae bacterium]MCX7639077.1 type VI secretion system membrane subunit TssM [Pyrinomonadaceae bacterium]MDW8303702.1 type VI secretion system membrane subunit TssM [Acidobacteriota bacterium]
MSEWHFNQLRYALGIGGLFSFYGVVSLIVWFAGEQLGYPISQRIVVIALVLLTLPISLVVGYVVTRRNNKSEVKQHVASSPQEPTTPSVHFDELQKAAEQVVQFLAASKHNVYSLPWYLVVGAHRSGKTALILGSRLNFQTLPNQRQSEIRFIRPTRSVEWRVATEAVFIDTAGRYLSENPVDIEEWRALLEVIKRYRPERLVDGIIVTASCEKLMLAEEKEIEEQAKILRARIDDVLAKSKVQLPTYVVFTFADSIEGFRDSFSTSQKEGEKLVWGATIPLEKSQQAAASLFDSEFGILQEAIMKRRLFRLSAPFPPIKQLKIFNFPRHFDSVGQKAGYFVSKLLQPNPFSSSPLFRGFYFTAVPVSRPKVSPDKTMAVAPSEVKETFFTEPLFRQVILRDRNLVVNFLSQKQGAPILGWVLMALGAVLSVLFLGLSGFSLYQNKLLLDEATEKAERVFQIYKTDAGRDLFTKTHDEVLREINAIEDLRKKLVELDEYERNGAPWWMRFGLYSGNRAYRERLLNIYFNAVEHRFKKPAIRKLESDLQEFASGQFNFQGTLTEKDEEVLGKNYDLLKAYLMLSGKPEYREHAESSFLASTLSDYWKRESKIGEGLWLVAQQQLEFWAKQVDRDEFPFILTNENLITQVRQKLRAYPAWQRYYKRKVTDISKMLNERQGDITVANILARNGASSDFIEGNYRVPNAFTIDGFLMMDEAIKNASRELSADDWVVGEESKVSAEGVEASLIQERYFRDYTDEWRKFVKGIDVRKYNNQADAERAFEEFISANSPMKILMKEIARQTNLSESARLSSWWGWIISWFQSKKAETGGNTVVERDFRPLFKFVEDETMAKYANALKLLRDRFAGMSSDEFARVARDLSQDRDTKLKLRDSENTVSNLLSSFNETPAGQDLANVLKKPIGNLRELLGAGVASQIRKIWSEQILPRAKEVEKGYPFEETGDADITKLASYLNPVDGDLTKFYNERLAKFFEEFDGKLKVKENSEVKFSEDFVTYLNNAFRLREALFGKNKTPSFSYEFRVQKVEGAIVEVTIDGQKVDSSGTGSTNMKFPATSGETGVFINVVTMSSGQGFSANTSSSNVSTSDVSAEGSLSRRFPGAWGLFRFFDAGSPRKNSTTGEYQLSYRIGNKVVNASIRPSGGDLFDKNLFRSVRAPQEILR